MNFCAFILWGITEGFFAEAFTCSAVNLLRILLLIKMAPYLSLIPDHICVLIVKRKAVHIEVLVITIGTFSVHLWEYLTDRSPNAWAKLGIGLGYGFSMLLCIVALLSFRTTGVYSFEMLAVGIPVQILSLAQITSAITIEYFAAIAVTTLAILALSFLKPCCMLGRKYAYGCLLGIVFLLQIAAVFRHFHMVHHKNKESPAVMSVTAYLYTLTATSSFQHRTNLPAIPHSIVYLFGATGLIVVNSVIVAVELIQKAKKGQRTIRDLQIILLPIESLFIIGWVTLQMYALCMEIKIKIRKREMNKNKIAHTDKKEDNIPRSPLGSQVSHELHEMEPLSPSDCRGATLLEVSESDTH
ncbi:uncharacterized protein LOC118771452 [Megalops cyprinoides]|uniref:uncharacterized protein LOC118771452 n=1 Tax=Megalops cyprinoides TaxID=118141 RepID=UPI0018645F3D|nr:uncharacterized protein LOC118771452 [Megalops cyprinoides]